jgi:phenylalanine-4-hydroxylase
MDDDIHLDKIKMLIKKGSIIEKDLPDNFENEIPNKVWNQIYQGRMKIFSNYGHLFPDIYLESVKHLGYNEHLIPTLSQINNYLKNISWKAVWAKELSIHEFCLLTAHRIFPIKASYRGLHEIEFALYPDFIHDLWGHIPLLHMKDLSNIIISLSNEFISLEYSHVDKELYEELYGENVKTEDNETEALLDKSELCAKRLLSRLFLLTVEFGLLKKANSYQIFGGGILSSCSEIINISSEKLPKIELKFSSLCAKKFSYFDKQNKYFYVNDYKDIYLILDEIKKFK